VLSRDEAERLLADQRERTLARLTVLTGEHAGFVEASLDSNADDEHDPEGATIAFERSQVDSLITQAREQLRAIEAAHARLDAGTWGTCEVCGEPIADGRLEVRPTATRCIRHA